MGVDPKLRETLTNHLKGRLDDVSEFSEIQKEWIEAMAKDPTEFLGAAGGGVGTSKEMIVERLIDRFSTFISRETELDDVRPYLDTPAEDAEDIQQLKDAGIDPENAGREVSPEDLQDLGMSDVESKRLLLDHGGNMTVTSLFLSDDLDFDQIQELL